MPPSDEVVPVPIPAPSDSTASAVAVDDSLIRSVAQSQAPSGRRQALRDIRRQLSETDLANPGVQRMILDALERADSDCEIYQAYVGRYYEADKRAAILEERQHSVTAIEIMFGVCVGLGGALIGIGPLFWTEQPLGVLLMAMGFFLIAGATTARIIKR